MQQLKVKTFMLEMRGEQNCGLQGKICIVRVQLSCDKGPQMRMSERITKRTEMKVGVTVVRSLSSLFIFLWITCSEFINKYMFIHLIFCGFQS